MAREFDFLDPSTKRFCEEDWVSPPWYLEEEITSSASGSSTQGSAEIASSGGIEIGSL